MIRKLVLTGRHIMASGTVLQRLEQRAGQADQLIAQLRSQIDLLKRNAGSSSCQEEQEKLARQNAALKGEVQQARQKLIELEVANGVKQVAMPTPGSRPVVAAVPPAQSQASGKKQEQKSPEKGEKKPKKEGKGGKQNAPAASEAVPVDVSCLDMRVGLIVNVKKHPDADTLYVEEVDLGEESTRTIVSGLVKHVPLEEMSQRLAIFLCNLKPAKMRGILSSGMIMCASTPEKVEILTPPDGCRIGDRVTVEGYHGTPPPLLPPKKKMWEQVQPDLLVNDEGLATYKGAKWVVEDKGYCMAASMKSVGIK